MPLVLGGLSRIQVVLFYLCTCIPVEKTVGSKVSRGTVNQNGNSEVYTTTDSTSYTVVKIAQLIQEAQTGSASTDWLSCRS